MKRSDSEKIALIQQWSLWLYDHTQNYDCPLGMELAYLWPAIANDEQIDVEPDSELVRILRDEDIDEDETIWEYINVVPVDPLLSLVGGDDESEEEV